MSDKPFTPAQRKLALEQVENAALLVRRTTDFETKFALSLLVQFCQRYEATVQALEADNTRLTLLLENWDDPRGYVGLDDA